jgi:multidrug efflux pump subunit AcrA (membrane-fusion protein)
MDKTKMNNNFADLLSFAGYTEAQIDRYFKLVARKRNFGPGSLNVSDRRFLLKAVAEARAAEAKLESQIAAAQKARVSGKQPVETKLHYRWIDAEREIASQLIEIKPGELSAYVIIREEQLRALSKYQPVLDQVDTSKRSMFNKNESELLTLAAQFGRIAQFDKVTFTQQLSAAFNEQWNDRWSTGLGVESDTLGAVIPDTFELEFRELVRSEVETFTSTVFPSVAV